MKITEWKTSPDNCTPEWVNPVLHTAYFSNYNVDDPSGPKYHFPDNELI